MLPSIASILRYHRKAKKLTQKEVSEKTGISLVSLSKYETGRSLPSVSNLHKLSEVIDFNYDEVYEILLQERESKSE